MNLGAPSSPSHSSQAPGLTSPERPHGPGRRLARGQPGSSGRTPLNGKTSWGAAPGGRRTDSLGREAGQPSHAVPTGAAGSTEAAWPRAGRTHSDPSDRPRPKSRPPRSQLSSKQRWAQVQGSRTQRKPDLVPRRCSRPDGHIADRGATKGTVHRQMAGPRTPRPRRPPAGCPLWLPIPEHWCLALFFRKCYFCKKKQCKEISISLKHHPSKHSRAQSQGLPQLPGSTVKGLLLQGLGTLPWGLGTGPARSSECSQEGNLRACSLRNVWAANTPKSGLSLGRAAGRWGHPRVTQLPEKFQQSPPVRAKHRGATSRAQVPRPRPPTVGLSVPSAALAWEGDRGHTPRPGRQCCFQKKIKI